MQKTLPNKEHASLSAAALRLASTRGWEGVTLEDVAKATKMPIAKLRLRFATTNDLVPIIAEQIDREAFASISPPTGNMHDRLFDLIMAHFDVVQNNRRAIESIADAAHGNRALLCIIGRATLDGAYRIIDAAQLRDKTPPRALVAAGLFAIYGWSFVAWRKDTSRDMTKTMAAVDRCLCWAERGVGFLKPHL